MSMQAKPKLNMNWGPEMSPLSDHTKCLSRTSKYAVCRRLQLKASSSVILNASPDNLAKNSDLMVPGDQVSRDSPHVAIHTH